MTKEDLCRLEQSELVKLIDDDRLIYLPCKVGDTIYCLERFCDGNIGDCDYNCECYECPNYELEIADIHIDSLIEIVKIIKKLGKTVFLTREEAEAKLKESEADNE